MFQMNNCAELFWNPCINVEVMAQTSSIYGLQVWPWPKFNLPEQMSQMSLVILKENDCAKWFWNPCINVEVMARTNSIYDHFINWPSTVTLTFNLPEQMFPMALLLLKVTTVQIILKFMQCNGLQQYFHLNNSCPLCFLFSFVLS